MIVGLFLVDLSASTHHYHLEAESHFKLRFALLMNLLLTIATFDTLLNFTSVTLQWFDYYVKQQFLLF